MDTMADSASTSSRPDDDATLVVHHSGDEPGARSFAGGDAIGRYVVIDEVGRGGMGQVLRAYDPRLRREIAVKVLHVAEANASSGTTGGGRILREAQAMAQLSHPNVVPVYDVEVAEGRVFIAMEYVPGQSLREWLENGSHPWREILAKFVSAGRGLAAAHAAGIVHRDFKPANVIVGEDGRVRVVDFGLARVRIDAEIEDAEIDPISLSEYCLDDAMTAAGSVLGTPRYMAPEQHRGGQVDAASDLYSFCLALLEHAIAGLGSDDVRRGTLLSALASSLGDLERLEEAERKYSTAMEVIERTRGGRHTSMSAPLMGLAELLLRQERAEAAEPHARRAIAVLADGDQDPTRLAQAEHLLARILWGRPDRRDEALALVTSALEHARASRTPNERLIESLEALASSR
jgi:serine/threonine protein kinase